MTQELTCIRCPMGCHLTVETDGDNITVSGNTCPRGAEYGRLEVTAPVRTVTSSVRVDGGTLPLVSVKTASDIPKDKIFDVMAEIRACRVNAPVHIGDVLIENAAGTGAAIVATRTVDQG
jgi:CxxC motif-containing protein